MHWTTQRRRRNAWLDCEGAGHGGVGVEEGQRGEEGGAERGGGRAQVSPNVSRHPFLLDLPDVMVAP